MRKPNQSQRTPMFTLVPIPLAAADSVTLRDVFEVLTLQHDYNATIVVLATAILGIGAGFIGSFLLLRKRALIGDALSHATLPGVCLAFMFMVALGASGKFLPGLLLGAAITGLLGVAAVAFISNQTRLHHGVRGQNLTESFAERACDRLPEIHVVHEHARPDDVFEFAAERNDRALEFVDDEVCLRRGVGAANQCSAVCCGGP